MEPHGIQIIHRYRLVRPMMISAFVAEDFYVRAIRTFMPILAGSTSVLFIARSVAKSSIRECTRIGEHRLRTSLLEPFGESAANGSCLFSRCLSVHPMCRMMNTMSALGTSDSDKPITAV